MAIIQKQNNFAFIDSQNLNLSIRSLGWKIDFPKFRRYLTEKYSVSKAYLFIGFIEGNTAMYTAFQEAGFICIFKPTLHYKDGSTKGNVDAELVLQAMIDYSVYDKAVLVSGDGDFHCLVKYLYEREKLKKILVPNSLKYSALLKRFPSEYLAFVSDLKRKLEYIKKEPSKDETL